MVSVMRPLCIREKSRSSSTMPERRSVSLTMIPIPRRKVCGSVSPDWIVSAQPLMAVSGVRSSWETDEMKSFFIFSLWPSSLAISLMVSQRSPISSFVCFWMRALKSPCAIRFAVAPIWRIGMRMERMK